jgi:endonuclease/exonuclease/phosphatase family metal-dependent hydrolase
MRKSKLTNIRPVFSTFHNFSGVGVASVPRLDYIFASAGCGLRGAAWVDREARGGVWPSDHFAVVADVEYQCD